MMKKNSDINKLFEDYGDALQPQERLNSDARVAMAASNAAKRSSSHAGRRLLHLAWIVPAVCIALVTVVLLNLPIFRSPNLDDNSQKPSYDENMSGSDGAVQYYAFADVAGRSISLEDCDDILNIGALDGDKYEVVSAAYYAFYTEEGDLRYIKALLGIRSAGGVFTELALIAEKDGYVREDLIQTFERNIADGGYVYESDYDDSGEFITQAYFQARGFHFYAVGRNGRRTTVVNDIISEIL